MIGLKNLRKGGSLLKTDPALVTQALQPPDENIVRVRRLVDENKRITVEQIAHELDISFGSTQSFLDNELRMS